MPIPETVNVRIEKGKAGLYHGVSDDMPSLLLSGESVDEVRAAAALIVKAVCEARGEPVPRVKVVDPPFPASL